MLVFLCGAALGAAFTRTFLHNRVAGAQTAASLQNLTEKLQLTPEQQRVVLQELDDYAKYFQNIEEERQDVAEHGRERILRVLNPEQQKKFKALFKGRTLPVNAQTGPANGQSGSVNGQAGH
jgi:Spy/CpxP family protein refolding chaperone